MKKCNSTTSGPPYSGLYRQGPCTQVAIKNCFALNVCFRACAFCVDLHIDNWKTNVHTCLNLFCSLAGTNMQAYISYTF